MRDLGFSSLRARCFAAVAGFVLWHGPVGAQQYDLRVFGVEDGLPGSTVNNLGQDSAGYLWVGTDRGFARFDGRHFTTYADLEEAGASAAQALRPSPAGALALSAASTGPQHPRLTLRNGDRLQTTERGLLMETTPWRSNAQRTIGTSNGLQNDVVNCLFQDNSGVVWIGTERGGLVRYTSDAVTWLNERDGLPSPVVTGIQHEADGTLSLYTPRGNLRWNGSALARDPTSVNAPHPHVRTPNGHVWYADAQGVSDSLPSAYALRVGRDTLVVTSLAIADDSMLLGTRNGLYRAPLDNSAAHWTHVVQAGIEDIRCLTRDRAGNVWIGTADRGVVRYRDGRTERWTRTQLASDHIRCLVLDAYQNLWVGTDRGFSLLELDELQEEVIDIRAYGLADGFPGIETMPNAGLLDTDSALWFGTTRGAVRFDPRRVFDDPLAPRTRITDVLLFFERPDWSPWSTARDAQGLPVAPALPYDRNHLTFTFTGLSLARPENVRFQYMLEGHDADWSPITADDRVTFSALAPGDYTFLVKARNGSGVWNDEPARFAFRIAPPFWATTAFRMSAGGALLLAFFGFQRLRDRRQRRTRERLERMVELRTRQLNDEKQRSDDLLLNILPETTAAELKENGTAQARSYNACTVLFSDFQGFTVLSEVLEAAGIVNELDRFFRAFDRITDTYGTEKIKTIGDAYMCASGVPNPTPTHALDAVLMALEMLDVVDTINAKRLAEGHPAWPIRIGLHSGPLIAGVVGEKKFAYDVWGDTVNLASRMESSGAPGRIHVTRAVMALVEPYVVAEPRGTVTLKGKGDVESWFIDRLRPEYSADAIGRKANEQLMGEWERMRA